MFKTYEQDSDIDGVDDKDRATQSSRVQYRSQSTVGLQVGDSLPEVHGTCEEVRSSPSILLSEDMTEARLTIAKQNTPQSPRVRPTEPERPVHCEYENDCVVHEDGNPESGVCFGEFRDQLCEHVYRRKQDIQRPLVKLTTLLRTM